MKRIVTPSQTVGPFFSFGLIREGENTLVTDQTKGQRIILHGFVYDGSGTPINDAMIEIWQADSEGRYRSADDNLNDGFTGFGRVETDSTGRFAISTIRPGPVPGPDGTMQAPHLLAVVYMRGLLSHVFTRIYFDDHEEANAKDPILALVPEERRKTLIAHTRHNNPGADTVYNFDVIMQGDDETVFFDV